MTVGQLLPLLVYFFSTGGAGDDLRVQSLLVGLGCYDVVNKVEDGDNRVSLFSEVVDGGVEGRQGSLSLLQLCSEALNYFD